MSRQTGSLVFCEVCKGRIATILVDRIDESLTGEMFAPRKHGHMEPFHPLSTYNDLRCPLCGCQPFLKDGRVMVRISPPEYIFGKKPSYHEESFELVNRDKDRIWHCNFCDYENKLKVAVINHAKVCKKRESKESDPELTTGQGVGGVRVPAF